jgi:hypothetical protein
VSSVQNKGNLACVDGDETWIMKHVERGYQGFLGQNLTTTNANVAVRNVAHLVVAGAHA